MQITDIALGGLRQAENRFNTAAAPFAPSPQPAGQPDDQVSLSDAAVSMLTANNTYQANLATIKVADDMQKSVLNLVG